MPDNQHMILSEIVSKQTGARTHLWNIENYLHNTSNILISPGKEVLYWNLFSGISIKKKFKSTILTLYYISYVIRKLFEHKIVTFSKTCLKRQLSKRPKIGFQDQLSLNVGQNYCRMLQGEHSAILLTFIKLPFVIKTFILSIFEGPFYTGFSVFSYIYEP